MAGSRSVQFWIMILRLFLMSRSLSSTMRRKDSGKTS